MKAIPTLLLVLLGVTSCKAPQFIQGGAQDGVTVSYRWNHRPDKPSELLVKIVNDSPSAQQLHLGLDLYYQSFTVEQFSTDTCIPAGRTFNGKLNGIYFIPQQITAEQAASPDTKVQLTEFTVDRITVCP